MVFRKAIQSDITDIFQVYREATKHMDDAGIHQWDELYPAEDIIQEDVDNQEMYISQSNNIIASVFTLSPKHDQEYEIGNWKYNNLRYSVIHRLCVNPICQHKGIGTETMKYIEEFLRNENYEAVRLDAFSLNPAALRLYEKMDFKKVGEVQFRKGLFYLFEKKL